MTSEERFDRIDANIERLSESVGEIRDNLARLTQYVLDFREEAARHFEVIDNRLEVLTATVANIDLRFQPLTKAILDFGKVSTQLTNDQFGNKHAIAELGIRMGHLEDKVSKAIQPAA